ncbi:MAG: hypothetical protein KatS3mg059_0942 [Thermomicrobiales bacterium]|nr:MAG: hypothetical protein KatS3mg059_0942 [Thermomicrobiales bacterium]
MTCVGITMTRPDLPGADLVIASCEDARLLTLVARLVDCP